MLTRQAGCFLSHSAVSCGYNKHYVVVGPQQIHIFAHCKYVHNHVNNTVASDVLQHIGLLYDGCLKENWFLCWPSRHVSQPSVPQGVRG